MSTNSKHTSSPEPEPSAGTASSAGEREQPNTDSQPSAELQRQARIIAEALFPSTMAASLDVSECAGPAAFKLHLDRLKSDVEDPVEAMILEQLALAHHRIVQLHVSASTARDVQAAAVYNGAAARLTGEFRRLALALRDYRTPLQGRSTTVIHRVEQWNQAQGSQEVGYARTGGPEGSSQRVCRDIEQDREANDGIGRDRFNFGEEPEVRGRRAPELEEAGTLDR